MNLERVFPAGAGVILYGITRASQAGRVSRRRGGDPATGR